MSTAQQVYDYFLSRGFQPHQAAAWAAHTMRESGGRHDALKEWDRGTDSPSVAPHSFGISQWNDTRLAGLVDFARRQGREIPTGNLRDQNYVRDLSRHIPLQTQLDYAWSELQGPERRAYDAMRNAATLEDAVAAGMSYYRPAGWTERTPTMGLGYRPAVSQAQSILDANRNRTAPVSGTVAELPARVPDPMRDETRPPIMTGAARAPERDESRPPIMAGFLRGFARGGAVAQAIRKAASETDTNPTEAQASAGNYRKGKFRWEGMEIALENPKGSTRSGTDKDGKSWRCVLPSHYGYLKESLGSDGDAVDCYIGDTPESNQVWVVDQVDAKSGRFDEHKCLLCFPSRASALASYEKAFSDGKGKDRIGSVTQFSVADFKEWLRAGDTTKPAAVATRSGSMSRAGQSAERLARFRGGRVGYADGGSPDSLGLVPPLPGVVIEPSTLTGRENATPALEGPRLRPLETALSVFDPLGLMPSAPRITVQQPVDTLTGRETGLRVPVSDQLPRPSEAENITGGLLGGAPAWRAAADVVGPAIGRGIAAIPRPAAIGAGGAGALTLASGEAEPRTETDPRVSRIQTLEKEIRDREKILEGFATRNFQSRTAREQASQPHQDAITQRRNEITRLTSEMDKEAASRRQSQSTIGELIPGFGLAAGVGGMALGAAGARGVAQRGVARYNAALDDATGRWAAAVQRADVQPPTSLARSQALTEAESLARQFDNLSARGPRGTTLAPAFMGAAGTELGFNLPTIIDRLRSEPGSPLRERVNETFTSPWEMGGRIIGAGLVGGSVGKMVGMREASRANAPLGYRAETEALGLTTPRVAPPTALREVEPPPSTRALSPPSPAGQAEVPMLPPPLPAGPPRAADIVSAPAPAAAPRLAPEAAPSQSVASDTPQVIIRSRGSDGRVRHHDERGYFTSNPRRPPSGDAPKPPRGRRTKGPDDDITPEKNGGRVNRADGGMVSRMVGRTMDRLRGFMGSRSQEPAERTDWDYTREVINGVGQLDPNNVYRPGLRESENVEDRRRSYADGGVPDPSEYTDVTDRGLNRAMLMDRVGVDVDAPFGERVAQGFRREAPNMVRDAGLAIGQRVPAMAPRVSQPSLIQNRPTAAEFAATHRRDFPEIYRGNDLARDRLTSAIRANEEAAATGAAYPSPQWQSLFSRGAPEPLPINQGVRSMAPPSGGPADMGYLRGLRDFYRMEAGTMHANGGAVTARADGGPVVSGPIVGPTGGREDALPVAVRSGCYVLPADVVSALGEGNTLKGNELLNAKYGNMRGSGGEMVDILISDGEYVIEPEGVMHDGRGNLQDGHRALDAFVKRVRADNIKMLKGLPGPAKA
jgi:hypothetical protein